MLVIHLKRFRRSLSRYHQLFIIFTILFLTSISGENRKIESHVKFPLDSLNLAPFITSKEANPDHTYSLYAVANQTGSLNTGHYFAYLKKGI